VANGIEGINRVNDVFFDLDRHWNKWSVSEVTAVMTKGLP
jgi:hypothetical protein